MLVGLKRKVLLAKILWGLPQLAASAVHLLRCLLTLLQVLIEALFSSLKPLNLDSVP